MCLKDRQFHALKLIITILLYTSFAQEVTSLPDLPGLFGTETDRGLKVTAVTSPASIRKINLPQDASMGRSESQGWILLLVTQHQQNCMKMRKSKAGLVSIKPPATGPDGSKAIENQLFGTFQQNIYAPCSKAEPCSCAGSARHQGKSLTD